MFRIVPPPGFLAGIVHGPDGTTPLSDVTVTTYDSDNNVAAINVTGTAGTWEIDLVPGTYHELLTKSGYLDATIPDFNIVTAETTHVSATMQTGGNVCQYVVGDANGNNAFNGLDVVYSVSYFKGGPQPPYTCECTPGHTWFVAGDVNASCNFNGLDVSYMVSYFKGGPAPHPCADCPPAR